MLCTVGRGAPSGKTSSVCGSELYLRFRMFFFCNHIPCRPALQEIEPSL